MEEGTIVIMDLDEFGEEVRERGWSEYRPNVVTGTLTSLVQLFVSKWFGTVVYGLDESRGTEEVIIEIPGVEPGELADDLERIKEGVNSVGGRITIVALKGFVTCKPASNRREAYHATAFRRQAVRALREAKRKGGNRVVVYG